jgi:L-threonylcarbamoyladenylate synthase
VTGASVSDLLDVAADRDAAVARAAEALRGGRLAVVPTDTVYGVAADAFNPTGTRRVFGAKRRSRSFPLPVLVRNPKQLQGLCSDLPTTAERLVAAYWPGPLTIVLRADPGLEWDLGDNEGVVAVRMPLDDVALDLVRAVGPLAVTSANRSGRTAPTTAAAAQEELGDLVEVYLDDGPRVATRPSTIIDVTRDEPHLMRQGPVDGADALAVARGELDPIEAADRLEAAALAAPESAVAADGGPDDGADDGRVEDDES